MDLETFRGILNISLGRTTGFPPSALLNSWRDQRKFLKEFQNNFVHPSQLITNESRSVP